MMSNFKDYIRSLLVGLVLCITCFTESCSSRKALFILDDVESYIQEHHLEDEVEFEGHLCLNACSDGPNLSIDGVRYQHVDSDVVTDLLEKALAKRRGEA